MKDVFIAYFVFFWFHSRSNFTVLHVFFLSNLVMKFYSERLQHSYYLRRLEMNQNSMFPEKVTC